jgi:exodeoxyribonuclease V gamma subunit
MAPLDGQAQLEAIIGLWRANLDAPLPVACKTALALLAGDDARSIYDGGYELRGEVDEACLARLWPDYASLAGNADWPDVAEALYGPLLQWVDTGIAITPIGPEPA